MAPTSSGRNLDRDNTLSKAFEPSLFVWATVMSRPAEDRAIVDAGLKALAFDSGRPIVCDEPTATYERASDEHGRLAVAAATNRLGLGDKIRLIPGHCDPTVNLYDWYVSCAATASSSSGRSPPAAPFINGCRSELTNNNGLWIVAPHEADVSALSMKALVRGKPVPACYFNRRSLTKKSKKVRPGLPLRSLPARGGAIGWGQERIRVPGRPSAFRPRASVLWALRAVPGIS